MQTAGTNRNKIGTDLPSTPPGPPVRLRDVACGFCKIIDREEPAAIFAETFLALAFSPLNPATEGHTLVVPKFHTENFLSAPAHLIGNLLEQVHELARDIFSRLPEATGMNLITSAGKSASQTVTHLHWHIVPRYDEDRLGDIWSGARDG